VATKLLFWLLGRFLDERTRNRSARPSEGGSGSPSVQQSSATPGKRKGARAADRGQRLAGDPEPLQRVLLVPRGRIAVLLEDGLPPRLATPATYLWPPIVPLRRPITLIPVTTEVVRLVLRVYDLVTFDGHEIPRVVVELSVQVDAADGYSKLLRLAAADGIELEAELLARAQRELGNEVQVAVRMNRLAHLRRLTLSEVLNLRGLPHELAGGALAVRTVNVTDVAWPDEEPGDPDEPEDAPAESAQPAELDLSTDARLRRIWSTHTETPLDGIASAQVGDSTTVVAVPHTPLGLADRLTLKEAFRRHLEDRSLTLVSTPAASYADVVQGWFREVDSNAARLVSVRALEPDSLRIIVDQAVRSRDGNSEQSIGTAADRLALRRLLPHTRVEFVTADDAAELADRRR